MPTPCSLPPRILDLWDGMPRKGLTTLGEVRDDGQIGLIITVEDSSQLAARFFNFIEIRTLQLKTSIMIFMAGNLMEMGLRQTPDNRLGIKINTGEIE